MKFIRILLSQLQIKNVFPGEYQAKVDISYLLQYLPNTFKTGQPGMFSFYKEL